MKLEILNMKPKRSWLPASALAFVFVLLYWPAINEFIYDWWHDDNYSHGFLIPVISGYFLWQKRDKIKTIEKMSALAAMFSYMSSGGIMKKSALFATPSRLLARQISSGCW